MENLIRDLEIIKSYCEKYNATFMAHDIIKTYKDYKIVNDYFNIRGRYDTTCWDWLSITFWHISLFFDEFEEIKIEREETEIEEKEKSEYERLRKKYWEVVEVNIFD